MAAVIRAVCRSRSWSFKWRSICTKRDWEPEEKVTHTGQQWTEDDYRLARFVDKPKQINEHFAIDLIAETPPIPVKDNHTWCNGGGGPLGHPKVYINLDQPGNHACGYCGLRFFQEPH
ncbi:NADH dehydrogenase [ubiquinone] iron-sulfur protein 6, mitochondrial isoform X1 [Centruroides vittatus]|uniref:NADH dehydrogenase [ubiquinone] iron-sulfur protein 6, mitochondrial isoform X1 n=1 Tax=Centruroides vittatus TaxID=120091 RepID=UPI00350EF991